MTRSFDYNDAGWESEVLECPSCHWKGTFHQGATCAHWSFTDCQCPKCDIFGRPMLAIVSHPSVVELLESGSAADKAKAQRLISKNKALWSVSLTSPQQLPNIPGDDDLYLTWDCIYPDHHKEWVVIRNGEQVLFCELATWEAIGFPDSPDSRYQAICEILKQKYGARVRDLQPTKRASAWLYGDKGSGPAFREWISQKVFGRQKE